MALRHRRLVTTMGLVAGSGVVAFVVSFPVRDILDQRAETRASLDRQAALDEQIDRTRQRIDRLEDPEEIRRLARERYGWVPPGVESYRVITPSAAAVPLPYGWPLLVDPIS
ncbi:MAG: septum formation initiator family protein [Actinobacteria bacterium]|nr:septum formation initiator family protein [Actinomycetota bacterium]